MNQINNDWNEPPMKPMKLIYRMCDKTMGTHMEGVGKIDCLKNFKDTFGCTQVVIIADNCSEGFINAAKLLGFKDFHKTTLGNSQSFAFALDLSLNMTDDQLVYFVEDDYLHHKDASYIIKEGIKIGDFVTLYDHPDKYGEGTPNPLVSHGGELTRVLLTKSCHWKETNSTTMTFACKVGTLRKVHEKMRVYLDTPTPRDYPMWVDVRFDKTLVSSIPGYSTHCHEPWVTPFFKVPK